MNILYINHYAGSPEMGMEFRPYYLSREWVKMGHKVTMIAGDYSHLRKKNPVVTEDFGHEKLDGIEYVWVKTGMYQGNGIKRAITMGVFVHKLFTNANFIANRWKPDIVISSSTYPLDTYPAQKIAKIASALYVHEVHDMWPATLYEVGGMPEWHPFVLLMQIAENSAYRHCDKCVSLLPYAKEYMVKHGLKEGKFVNIQNGVVKEEWETIEKIPEQHRLFFESYKDRFIVGYFGGHAISNALDNILNVAKFFLSHEPNSKVIFVLVGEGIEKQKLVHRAKEENINNIFFLPSVDKKNIPDLLTYFDCSYMTGIDSPLYRFGLCLNKMYDSMMAGIPIICAFNAPTTLIKEFECGLQCNPNDIQYVVESIRKIELMTNEERRLMGLKGRRAILQYFTYDRLAKTFIDKVLNLGVEK